MPSPLYSGAAAIMLGTMTARTDLGWAYFEKLKADDAVAVRGNGAVLTAVANGEKPYGVLVDFMAFNAKAKGSPIDFVFPAEGVPAVTEPVAMLKTDAERRRPRARSSISSCPTTARSSRVAMGYIPARASVGMPPWLPAGTQDQPDADRHRERRADEQRQPQALRRSVRQLTISRPPHERHAVVRCVTTRPARARRGAGAAAGRCVVVVAILSLLPLVRLVIEASRPAASCRARRSRACWQRRRPGPPRCTASSRRFGGTLLADADRRRRRARRRR